MGDLLINDKDAYKTWGVKMGDGFLDALSAPCEIKDLIENESRKEHGKRVLLSDSSGNSLVRLSSRDVTLTFNIHGTTTADCRNKKNKLLAEFFKGKITIEVPELENEIYKLIYKGKSSSFGWSLNRMDCKITIKFEEPNPSDRE